MSDANAEASKPADPVLEVMFPDEQGGSLSFMTKKEVCNWVSHETSLWSWATSTGGISDSSALSCLNPLRNSLQNLNQTVAQCSGNPDNINLVNVKNNLENWRNAGLPHSRSAARKKSCLCPTDL